LKLWVVVESVVNCLPVVPAAFHRRALLSAANGHDERVQFAD